MLPVAIVWQRIMRNEVFVATINCAIGYLFSWTAAQVKSKSEKEEEEKDRVLSFHSTAYLILSYPESVYK